MDVNIDGQHEVNKTDMVQTDCPILCNLAAEDKTANVAEENLMEIEISLPKTSDIVTPSVKEVQGNIFVNPIATGIDYAIGNSSLTMLATYGSESESEVDVDKKEYRVQSSSSDSSSSDSSSESSSSSESENESSSSSSECLETIEMEIEEKSKNKFEGPMKVKGELLIQDLPPIEDLKITVAEAECVEIGKITSVIDQLVLVEAITGIAPLDLDTVLFLEKGRKVLGKIFDVLGQISNPLYCIRFNSANQIMENGISVGLNVYCAPKSEHTSFVILSNLMTVKGSDASWENDVEPSGSHIEYSDDEQERSARRALKAVRVDTSDPSKKPKTMNNKQNYRHRNQNMNYNNYRGHRAQQHRPHDFMNSWHNNFNNNMPGPSYFPANPGYYQVQFPPPPSSE